MLFSFFSFCFILVILTLVVTGAWCPAAGKKNQFLSYPESGRSNFGIVIIDVLAEIVVSL